MRKTKVRGSNPPIFRMKEAEYLEASEDMTGICLSCGNWKADCEPDARNYKCDSCGLMEVYGLEEALAMERIIIS